jgi:hypothetical protein
VIDPGSGDVYDMALFASGAVAYAAPARLIEGAPPEPRWRLPDHLDDEYALVTFRATQRSFTHKPDVISVTGIPYGAYAIVPYARIGSAVLVFLAPLLTMTEDKSPRITVQPMTRDEIVAMREVYR